MSGFKGFIKEAGLERTLTPKMKNFAKAMVASEGDAKSSLFAAGYSSGTSAKTLLENPLVIAEIDRLGELKESNSDISAEWIIDRYKTLVERAMDAQQVYDRSGNPTGEWKCDYNAAAKALDALSKIMGVYEKDNSQKHKPNQINIQNNNLSKLTKEELETMLALNDKANGGVIDI